MNYLSKYFTEGEFTHSVTANSYNINNNFQKEIYRNNAEYLCREYLDIIREYINSPIYITSGYRCPQLNKAVSGHINSYHQYGLAADITSSEYKAEKLFNIIKQLIQTNKLKTPDQVILYKKLNFIHFGISSINNRNQFFTPG